ncbi:MAG: YdcF family protein [Bacteroidetes bacterium]|nr:YdcF family protein [Bacteroidota bacterium]
MVIKLIGYLKRKRRTILFLLIFCALFIVIGCYSCDKYITKWSYGKIYDQSDSIPYHKVGLLLGTSKFLKNNHVNPYYQNRISAANELLVKGKITYLVVSGDNSTHEYNEPRMMKDDLISLGIDSNLIYLDYAGFRTFDSMIRLKEIFGQTSTIIISQQFHNERALYIASQHSIDAVAFNAKDVGTSFGFKTQMREKLARVKVFIDEWLGISPKFLGPKVVIPSQFDEAS